MSLIAVLIIFGPQSPSNFTTISMEGLVVTLLVIGAVVGLVQWFLLKRKLTVY
jgi:hypothetical protein